MPAIGDERARRARARNEIAAHPAGDRLAGIGRNRDLHPHAPFRHVPLPSHPEQGVALLHQRAVTELGFARRIGGVGRILKDRQNPLAAAIAGLVEKPAIAASRVEGLQQIEVRRELDQALRILRREIQVDDAAVLRPRRIEGEINFAGEFFIRPGGAERAAVEDRLAAFDPEPGHAGDSVQREEQNGDERERQVAQHARYFTLPSRIS